MQKASFHVNKVRGHEITNAFSVAGRTVAGVINVTPSTLASWS